MKGLRFFLAITLASGVYAQTSSEQAATVTGVVRDSVTRMPLRKAVVIINPIRTTALASPGNFQISQTVVTGASGAFTIANLAAGQYRIFANHPSYPPTRGAGNIIEVKSGESSSTAIDLIPGASVSGHVVDEDGEPLQGCTIQPHPVRNPDQGVAMFGNSTSNEDGDYRFHGVPTGKYILTAQCFAPAFQPRPFSAGPDPNPSRAYPPQYYPLAADSKGAQVIELTPGAEKSAIDFKMRPAPIFQVHGTIPPTGTDARTLQIQLIPVDKSHRNFPNGFSIDPAKRTFDFRQVFAGSYMLIAFTNDSEDKRMGSAQPIEVTDRPLEVTLELRRAVELSGKVELDGGKKLALNTLGIQLFPTHQTGSLFSQTQVAEDGSFTLKGLVPGVWRLQVSGPSVFVKSAWLGGTEVTNAPIDLSNGAAGALRVIVSTNTGTIHGSAPTGQSASVQRIDEDSPFQSIQESVADQSGQYKFAGLFPGKYRVSLTDGGFPFPVEGGQEVTLHEGETITLDLKPQPN